jgi:hypothetical protein
MSRGRPWPYRTMKAMNEAGYVFLETSLCRYTYDTGGGRESVIACGRTVLWFRTPEGKKMPIDGISFSPHFATCAALEAERAAVKIEIRRKQRCLFPDQW